MYSKAKATVDLDGGVPLESKYRNLLGDDEGSQFFDHFTDFIFQDDDPYEKSKRASSSSAAALSSSSPPPPPVPVKKPIQLQVPGAAKKNPKAEPLPKRVMDQATDETKPPVMIDRLWRIYQRTDLKQAWFHNQKEMILPKLERLVEMRLQIYSTISKFIASGKSLWMDPINTWPADPELLDVVFFRSGKAMMDDRWSFWLTWRMFHDCVLKHCKTKDKAELALANWMDLETKLLHIRMKHSSPIQSPHSLIRGLFQQMYLEDTILERVDKTQPNVVKMLEYYEHCTCFELHIRCECTTQHKSWWSDKNWFIRSSNFDVVLGNKYFTGNNNPRLKMWPTGQKRGEWYLPLIAAKDIILKEQQKVWNKMIDQAKDEYQKGEFGKLDATPQLKEVTQKMQSGFYVFGHQLPNPNDRFGLYKKAALPEGMLPWVFMNKIAPRCIRQLWTHPEFHVDHNARTLIGFFCRKFGVSMEMISSLLRPKMQGWWVKHKNYNLDKCNKEWKAVSSSIDHALHRSKHPVMYSCFTLQNDSSDGKMSRCPFIATHTRDGYTECKRQCQTSTLRDIEDLYAHKTRMPLARPKHPFTPNTNLANPIDVTLHMIQYVNDIGLDLDKLF